MRREDMWERGVGEGVGEGGRRIGGGGGGGGGGRG